MKLTETESYELDIYQIELTDPVIGGADGIANLQAKQLANRTNWLKAAFGKIVDGTTSITKALKLATARKISLGGALSGSANFDGSADITIEASFAEGVFTHNSLSGRNSNNAHPVSAITGLLEFLDAKADKSTSLSGYGIIDAYTKIETDNMSTAGKVVGRFANLKISATGTNTNVSISADEIVLKNSSNNSYVTARALALSISTASAGVNGLDTGSIATNTWYSLWVIWNGTTLAGLISLSTTAPALPTGYTHKARVGWIRTDNTANKYPLSFIQYGADVRYKLAVGSNMTGFPVLASGAQGSIITPIWVAVAVSTAAPSTAAKINVCYTYGNGVGQSFILAPNNSYGGINAVTNPPLMSCTGYSGDVTETKYGDIVLESTNIYYAASAGYLLACGWRDNL